MDERGVHFSELLQRNEPARRIDYLGVGLMMMVLLLLITGLAVALFWFTFCAGAAGTYTPPQVEQSVP